MDNPEKVKILWIGPGMGNIMHQGPWLKTFKLLRSNENCPLRLSYLRLIDLVDTPKFFYAEPFAEKQNIIQESFRADFFNENGYWDVIILDFIEAWQLGRTYWPSLSETPFDLILHHWEEKLKQLRPLQVWIRHDRVPHSTIIPNLRPQYNLVVNVEEHMRQTHMGYEFYADISISNNALFWHERAAKVFEALGQDLHVWQLKI